MKLSNTILLVTLSVATAGLFGSNYILKKEYSEIDKTDPYWNYRKILETPFSHLVITGGNISNIVFEESPTYYVKMMKEWRGASDESVKAIVKNDTLYLDFANKYIDIYEKYWLQDVIPVRISGNRLISVKARETKLVIDKFDQPRLSIDVSGDSKVHVNCFRTKFDEIVVNQQDSSLITFTVSNELFVGDSIHVVKVGATGSGTSLLNLRSATIDSLTLRLTDNASIALNGASLKKWGKRISE